MAENSTFRKITLVHWRKFHNAPNTTNGAGSRSLAGKVLPASFGLAGGNRGCHEALPDAPEPAFSSLRLHERAVAARAVFRKLRGLPYLATVLLTVFSPLGVNRCRNLVDTLNGVESPVFDLSEAPLPGCRTMKSA